jgi:hypothetical protein
VKRAKHIKTKQDNRIFQGGYSLNSQLFPFLWLTADGSLAGQIAGALSVYEFD